MSLRRRVFICSRLRAKHAPETKGNILRALEYCAWACSNHSVSPFAPHAFFTRFLNDSIPAEREAGIQCANAQLAASEEVWVFVVDGVISTGMQAECDLAIKLGIPLKWFVVDTVTMVPTQLVHASTDKIPSKTQLLCPTGFAAAVHDKFAAIEAALKDGSFYEDVDSGLDDLLGTTLEERDSDIESQWENLYREEL